MLTDDQLGDRLRERLAAEVAHLHASPGMLPALHRRLARRTAARRIAVAVPALAAVATAAALTAATVRHPPATTATASRPGTTADQPQARDVAYVTARTRAALAHVSDYVMRGEKATHGYRGLELVDLKTGRARYDTYGPDGQRLYSITMPLIIPSNGGTHLIVDYPHRAWWAYQLTPPSDASDPANRPLTNIIAPVPEPRPAPVPEPTEIADWIANGTVQILGDQKLHGHQTLHLRITIAMRRIHASMDMWVDTQTYLPYRVTTTKTGPTSTSDYDWLLGTSDYKWLPRTRSTLAALDLVPPAGFTHRDPATEPEASRGGHG